MNSLASIGFPWLASHVRETVEALGSGWWDYGIEANRHVLETFIRYAHEEGLARQRRPVEDLFAPSTGEAFRV